jgi:hypothetical protein
MPHQDCYRTVVLDLEQGDIARVAERDEQFPQEGIGFRTLSLAAGEGKDLQEFSTRRDEIVAVFMRHLLGLRLQCNHSSSRKTAQYTNKRLGQTACRVQCG